MKKSIFQKGSNITTLCQFLAVFLEGFFELLPSSLLSAKFLAFCQVLGFSAKFMACLLSLVQSLQSFCQVCGSFCQVRGTESAKIANAKLLHTPTMEFVDFVLSCSELCNFMPRFRVGRKHKTWQKSRDLGRSSSRNQKHVWSSMQSGKGICPATSTG